MAALIAIACGAEPSPPAAGSAVAASQPAGSAAPVGSELAAGDVYIGPSTADAPRVRRRPATGEIERIGLPLRAQIALAWGVHPRDVELRVPLPPGRFDVRARPVPPATNPQPRVREALTQRFGLTVRSERRPADVLVLRRIEGAPALRSSATAAAGAGVRRPGEYRVEGAPLRALARFLRELSRRPVVDETGLEGRYDLLIEWDARAGPEALRTALADAGFELEEQTRQWPVLVVERRP